MAWRAAIAEARRCSLGEGLSLRWDSVGSDELISVGVGVEPEKRSSPEGVRTEWPAAKYLDCGWVKVTL